MNPDHEHRFITVLNDEGTYDVQCTICWAKGTLKMEPITEEVKKITVYMDEVKRAFNDAVNALNVLGDIYGELHVQLIQQLEIDDASSDDY